MIVQALIPLFLAVHLPSEQYGNRNYVWPEYIFTVHMNMTRTPQCPDHVSMCDDPSDFRITSRLHCIPNRNKLSCSLRHVEDFDFGMSNRNDDIVNWRKNVTEETIKLHYNENGIEKMIVSQMMHTHDLNILRIVVELLHPGDDFDDIEDGTFESVAESTIGKCNVVFKVHRRPVTRNTAMNRNFHLELLPRELRLSSDEMIVIDKTTNLNNCSYYAENYYRKYGNSLVCQNERADLINMTSRMEISETSFVSFTERKGTMETNDKTYDVTEFTEVILEDIQRVVRRSTAFVLPVETKILANYDMTSIYTGEFYNYK